MHDSTRSSLLVTAYTMFNVYLPKLLETRLGSMDPDNIAVNKSTPSSLLVDSLWNVVIYSIGGCPGALVSPFEAIDIQPLIVSEARRISGRIITGPAVVAGREHFCHCVLLCRVCPSKQSPSAES